MGKNKKKNRKFIPKDSIANLCKEVNAFDKEFGIKLKHIDPYNEPEMVFQSFVDSFKTFLYSVIYEINGITSDVYLNKKKKIRNIDKSKFTELSILEWEENDTYDVNSYLFKCRFLTVFLLEYIERIDKIALNKYDYLSIFKSGKYENAYFYMKKIVDDTRRFIKVMISGNSYGNIMLKMNQNCSYIKTKKTDPRELNKYIREIKHELKIGLKESLLKEKEMPEDIAINSILQLAYLLCTGDTSLDELPNFKYIEGANTTYELRGLTEALGSAIIDNSKYNKRPIMYLAYNKANPNILSRYKDINENWFISIGVRALEYTKFFCNDKYITRFINKMI